MGRAKPCAAGSRDLKRGRSVVWGHRPAHWRVWGRGRASERAPLGIGRRAGSVEAGPRRTADGGGCTPGPPESWQPRYEAGGAPAAGRRFAETTRGEGSYRWPADLWERFLGNADHLFGHEWPGFAAFHPDEAALRSAPFPIGPGRRRRDRGTYCARPS